MEDDAAVGAGGEGGERWARRSSGHVMPAVNLPCAGMGRGRCLAISQGEIRGEADG